MKMKKTDGKIDAMKYAVVYASSTGNTGILAHEIQTYMEKRNGECVWFGKAADAVSATGLPGRDSAAGLPEADILFAGFWTDKGNCSEEMGTFLESLHGKKLFLFGTAGFGGSEEYFSRILGQVRGHIAGDNEVIGTYMCQGKMPVSVKARYEKMLESDPENERMKAMITNFDQALSHPDERDLAGLADAVEDSIRTCFAD